MARIHSTNDYKKAPQSSDLFYVLVKSPEDNLQFLDASAYIGRELPFKSPEATVAVRSTDNVVAFSYMKVTKKVAKNLTGQTVQIPGGSLKRLRMRTTELDIAPGTVVLEIAGDEDNAAQMHTLHTSVDGSGITHLSFADDLIDDENFQLPKFGAVKLSLYMKSPTTDRTVAVSFIGYFGGRPGATETAIRSAGKVLNAVAQLELFRVLTGIVKVDVPLPPGNWANQANSWAAEEAGEASAVKPVRLFNDALEVVATGTVTVGVNLTNANPTIGQVQLTIEPSAELADAWPQYSDIARQALNELLVAQMASG